MKTIKDLENIGFENVGRWFLNEKNNGINFEIEDDNKIQILYSFVLKSEHSSEIMYIGKTIKTITGRLKGYRRPGPTQNTNIRLNSIIYQLLQETNNRVEIFVLKIDNDVDFKGYAINLAAGLEDILIKLFSPKNNLHGVSKIIEEPELDEKHIVLNVRRNNEIGECYLGNKTASNSNLEGKINLSFIPANFLPEIGDVVTIHLGEIEFNANFINANASGNYEPRINSVLIGRWLVDNNIHLCDLFYVKVCNNNTFYFYTNAQ